MVYFFKVHKADEGYWAECVELKGCQTQGDTLEELQRNAEEALNGYLSEPEDSNVLFPRPKNHVATKASRILRVPVDPQVAMAMAVRQARIKAQKTQAQVAKSMGIRNISAYQKFEDPLTCNPGIVTLARLKQALPDLEVDEVIAL